MRRNVGLSVVVALVSSFVLAPEVHAQAKPVGEGIFRIDGTVIGMNKEKSTFLVRQKNRNNMTMTIAYTDDTRFSYLNEPASLADVKDSRRVICLGKLNEKGTRMTALVVDVRTPRK